MVDSLLWASLYNVDVTFTMHNGNVKTRLNQLKAYDSKKGLEIAKAIILQKIENENNLV